MTSRIDLDQNATTPVDVRVRDAMVRVLDGESGNPSSIHDAGRRARELVENARREVARLIHADPTDLVFTSGGTESDFLGIVGGARAMGATRVISTPLEHPAVKGAIEATGLPVEWLAVDGVGRFERPAQAPGALVSIALANHEIGNLGPVGPVSGAAAVHCDAVQALGKMPLDVHRLGADLVSISAHKIGGPKGVGALWIRPGGQIAPVHTGGHQERGLRPGTENVVGIAGFGEAARLLREEGAAERERIARLRDRLETGLRGAGARVHGDLEHRVCNTTNVAFEGVSGELLVAALDLEGVSASTGAACTSGSVDPSPVLLALGLSRARAAEGVRFSLGRRTTEEEIDVVIQMVPGLIDRIRRATGHR